jgi:hypothetical protein
MVDQGTEGTISALLASSLASWVSLRAEDMPQCPTLQTWMLLRHKVPLDFQIARPLGLSDVAVMSHKLTCVVVNNQVHRTMEEMLLSEPALLVLA